VAGRVILRPRLARLTLARAVMDLPAHPTKSAARIAATFRCFGMTGTLDANQSSTTIPRARRKVAAKLGTAMPLITT
jgi:hypothetical protein